MYKTIETPEIATQRDRLLDEWKRLEYYRLGIEIIKRHNM